MTQNNVATKLYRIKSVHDVYNYNDLGTRRDPKSMDKAYVHTYIAESDTIEASSLEDAIKIYLYNFLGYSYFPCSPTNFFVAVNKDNEIIENSETKLPYLNHTQLIVWELKEVANGTK